MALISPDLSEAPKQLAPGDYSVRVMSAEIKESKAGNPYVNWKLETFGAEEVSLNGKTIYHSTPVGGKGVWLLQRLFKAAVGEELGGEFDTEALVGREVAVTLGEELDQSGEPKAYLGVKAVRALR